MRGEGGENKNKDGNYRERLVQGGRLGWGWGKMGSRGGTSAEAVVQIRRGNRDS